MEHLAVFLTKDLLYSSQVQHGAARAGWKLDVIMEWELLLQRVTDDAPELVVLDLTWPGIDPVSAVRQLREASDDGPPVLAVGPHVQHALFDAAREAECQAVVSRGHFHGQTAEVLRRFAPL